MSDYFTKGGDGVRNYVVVKEETWEEIARCGSVLDFKGYDGDYCPYCGQRIDWSESE